MNSQETLQVFRDLTKKLADNLQQMSSLFQHVLTHLPQQPAQAPASPIPVSQAVQQAVSTQPQEQEELVEYESIEEVQPKETEPKETKTKKIKKESKEEGEDKKLKKNKKISHKPKAPASSFLLFFKAHQADIARSYPNYGVTQLTKVAAKCWKELSTEDKQPYVLMCDQERKLYQEKMQKYRLEYPEEIAEKEKDRKLKKEKGKETPRKEKAAEAKEEEVLAPVVMEEESYNSLESVSPDSLGAL